MSTERRINVLDHVYLTVKEKMNDDVLELAGNKCLRVVKS